MNEGKKIFGFELEKLRNNRLMVLVVAILLASVFIFCTVNFFCVRDTIPLEQKDREAVLDKYRVELSGIEAILSGQADVLSGKDRERYAEMSKKLEFFINSGTIETDYLNGGTSGGGLAAKYESREFAGFMFYFGELSAFFLWALSIAGAGYLFSYEYHTNTLKNVLASGIRRNKIFIAKLLFLLTFLTAVFLVFTLFALGFGIQNKQSLFVMHNDNYRAVDSVAVFLSRSAATYVVMLVFAALSVLGGILSKNLVLSIATPCLAMGISILAFIAISDAAAVNPAFNSLNDIDKIPILSLQFHIGTFDWFFALSLCLHFVAAVLLLVFACRRFTRQDI